MNEKSCKHCENCPVWPNQNERGEDDFLFHNYNKFRCNVDCLRYESNGETPCSVKETRPHRFNAFGEKIYLTQEDIQRKIAKRLARMNQTKNPKKSGSNFTKKKKKKRKKRRR